MTKLKPEVAKSIKADNTLVWKLSIVMGKRLSTITHYIDTEDPKLTQLDVLDTILAHKGLGTFDQIVDRSVQTQQFPA